MLLFCILIRWNEKQNLPTSLIYAFHSLVKQKGPDRVAEFQEYCWRRPQRLKYGPKTDWNPDGCRSLGCDSTWSGRQFLTFRNNYYYPEDTGDVCL